VINFEQDMREQAKAMVADVIRQVFLVEEKDTKSPDIFEDFPKLELKAIKQRKIPMVVVHRDLEDEDLALIPFKCLTVLLRHSLIVAVAKELIKQEGNSVGKG